MARRMTAFRLPSELIDELRGAAVAIGVNQSQIVCELLEAGLVLLREKYCNGNQFPLLEPETPVANGPLLDRIE